MSLNNFSPKSTISAVHHSGRKITVIKRIPSVSTHFNTVHCVSVHMYKYVICLNIFISIALACIFCMSIIVKKMPLSLTIRLETKDILMISKIWKELVSNPSGQVKGQERLTCSKSRFYAFWNIHAWAILHRNNNAIQKLIIRTLYFLWY